MPYKAFVKLNSNKGSMIPGYGTSFLKHNTKTEIFYINQLNKQAEVKFATNPDSALYLSLQAVDLARKIQNHLSLAIALLQIGKVYFYKGKFSKSRIFFNEAGGIFKELDNRKGLSTYYLYIGKINNRFGNYKVALSYLTLAYKISNEINDIEAITTYYKEFGIVYFNQGQFSKSLDYSYKGLFIAVENHYETAAAQLYNNIGADFESIDEYDMALEYFNKCIYILKKTHQLTDIGTVYGNIGELFLLRKNYDEAIHYLDTATNISTRLDEKENLSYVKTNLGICLAYKNQFKKAIEYIKKSLRLSKEYGFIYNEGYALISLSRIYNKRNNYVLANLYAERAYSFAVHVNNLAFKVQATLQLNRAQIGLRNFKKANQIFNLYLELNNKLEINKTAKKLYSYSSRLNFEVKEKQILQKQYDKDIIYQQKLQKQQLINVIYIVIIGGLIVTLAIFLWGRKKYQKINNILISKNKELLLQRESLNKLEKALAIEDERKNISRELHDDIGQLLSVIKLNLNMGSPSQLQEAKSILNDVIKELRDFTHNLYYGKLLMNDLVESIKKDVERLNATGTINTVIDINWRDGALTEQNELLAYRIFQEAINNIVKHADAKNIHILISSSKKLFILVIKDDGAGFLENDVKKGLGLKNMTKRAEMAGGQLKISSQPGKGTEIRVIITHIAKES